MGGGLHIPGAADLALHHFYRAMAWLGEEAARPSRALWRRAASRIWSRSGRSSAAATCSPIFVVFMDTTSLSFEGEGGASLGEHGYSKDFSPDLRQMILGLVMDGAGWPVCTEMWRRNTADVTVLRPIVDPCGGALASAGSRRRRPRHDLGPDHRRAGGGGLDYILGRASTPTNGCGRSCSTTPHRLSRWRSSGSRARPSSLSKRSRLPKPAISSVATRPKPRMIAPPAKLVAALDAQLRRGDKALIGNAGYRRYLRKTTAVKGQPAFEIDPGKLAEAARFDGVFVLRTNTRLTPLQAVLRYRDLLRVENLFRRAKAVMRTRPIFHSDDAAIRGHVFCSFLALLLQKRLDDLAEAAGTTLEWKTLLRDLDRLQQLRIRHRGADWLVRTDATPALTAVFRHAKIALPPRVKPLAPPATPPPKSAANRRGRPKRSATAARISPESP